MCRECGKDVTLNNLGDDGTRFFKCDECGIINETKVEPKNVEVPKTKYEPPENPNGQTILIQRLKEVNLSTRRFLKVDNEKKAFEKEWQNRLYAPEDLADYPCWGVCGGNDLVPVDVDNKEMVIILRKILPPTLEYISPRRQLPHFYFKVVNGEVQNKTLHLPDDEEGAGEIRSQNQYLVAPGTTIKFKDLKTGEEKTGTYQILHNRPIATLTYANFMEAITPYLGKKSLQKITREIMKHGAKRGTRHAYGIKYATRLIRYEHLDPIAALDILKRWNKKCKPPMNKKDLERMIRNAVGYAQNDPQEKQKEKGQTKQDYGEIIKQITGKDVFVILLRTLSHTVKRDHYAKQFDILHCASAYCNPINELKDAPTSEGKTYPLIQAVKLFPPEDVMLLGGLSPTALAHQHGVPVDEEGTLLTPKINELQEQIDQLELDALSAKRKEKAQIRIDQKQLKRELAAIYQTAQILVNLENKIMVFLENPHPETWARLRPIMSHDKWRIAYKFTDRVGTKGPLKQVTVVIEGWPVFIAFKAEHQNPEIWDQILSRGTNVPVEMTRVKYRAGVNLEALKRGLPQAIVNRKLHKSEVERAQQIVRAVKKRLLEIKANIRKQTGMDAVPNMFWIPFYKKIGTGFPAEIGVHMRESQRFLTIIQMHAAINVYARPILEIDGVEHIICTLDDYRIAYWLFFSDEAKSVIFSKLPKHKVDFFEKVLLPLWETKSAAALDEAETKGISTEEMRKKYFKAFNKTISSNTINYHYLRILEDMNFISRSPDPDNKTRKLTVVLTKTVASEESPIETHFKNGDVFSLAELKEAFNSDFQLMHQTPPLITIKTYKNEELSLEELYAQFFYSRRGALHIDSKPAKTTTTEEKKPVETPVSEMGDDGGLDQLLNPKCGMCGLPLPTPELIREIGTLMFCFKCWEEAKNKPVCIVCQDPILDLKNLSNVDGETVHKKCVEETS